MRLTTVGPSARQRVLCWTLAAAAASCGKGDGITGPPDLPGPPAVATVEVSPSPVSLVVGGAVVLSATVLAQDAEVARLIIAGGSLRVAGHRLVVRAVFFTGNPE